MLAGSASAYAPYADRIRAASAKILKINEQAMQLSMGGDPKAAVKNLIFHSNATLNGKLIRALLNDFNEARAQDEQGERLLRRAMVRDKRQIKGREIDENPRMVRIWYGNRRHGSQA